MSCELTEVQLPRPCRVVCRVYITCTWHLDDGEPSKQIGVDAVQKRNFTCSSDCKLRTTNLRSVTKHYHWCDLQDLTEGQTTMLQLRQG